MLEHWHEFYLLLGTAAAALVALLFVAASIGVGYLSPGRAGGTRTFMSPVVVHYTNVLLISLLALIPTQTPQSLAATAGAVAVAGIAYSVFITGRVVKNQSADLFDRLAYGLSPLAAYVLLLAASVLTYNGHDAAATTLASALVLLLVVNIRNAWDLMLTFVRMHSAGPKRKAPKK